MELDFLHYLGMFILAGVVFLAFDLVWLGIIAKDLYRKELKAHIAKEFNAPYAVLFYVTFLIGMLFFAVVPAVNEESLGIAMGRGAAYGFFTYATYGLTNAATLKNWSRKLVPIDLAWGTFLSFVVASITYSLYLGILA